MVRTKPVPWHAVVLAIVILALCVRIAVALSTVYLWDEDREWIVLASSISFDPADPHLPLQGFTHPVLPAYFMKAGTLLLGENAAGFRLLSVLAGATTVLLLARLAGRWGGGAAGAATALLLALNEYHVVVSSVAVDMVFYLFFLALASVTFTRFLELQSGAALVLTGLFTGLAYMCNERAAMLVPIWGLALLITSNGRWVRRWPAWAALAVFVAVISPDLLKGFFREGVPTQTSFSEHLTRFSGLSVSYQPAGFFGKDLVGLILKAAGHTFKDWAPEYAGMNELFGAALVLGVAFVLFSKTARREPVLRTALAWFCFAFVALVLLRTEFNEEKGLGPQAWYWADLTLLPAILLAGVAIGRLDGWRRIGLVALLAGGCLVSAYRVVDNRLGMPWVKVGASPTVLVPRDGRMVEVRTGFLTCVVCDPFPSVTLDRVDAKASGRWGPAESGDVVRATTSDPRRVSLRARRDLDLYVLRYVVREASGRETPLAIDILVRDAPSRWPRPFWLDAALAADPPRGAS